MSSSAAVYQDILVEHLRVIIPHGTPHVNVRKQTQFKYSAEGSHYLELDVWYPDLNLCFEFQDNYHYLTTWYNQKSLLQIQQNDDFKRDQIQRTGMSIVIVPCWWSGDAQSLQSTIHFYRPDVCNASSDPIPLSPPANFYQTIVEIPNVGELMYASFPTNENSLSLEKWWLGEKYDGVRFCWSPIEHKLFTRYANEIQLLSSYFDALPPIFIDGELWFGRGSFSLTTTLVKNVPQVVPWELLRLVSFDCPAIKMQSEPFEDRYKVLLINASYNHPFVQVVARYLCDGVALDAVVQQLVQEEGEGIIMRKAESQYEHGRSDSLIKMKSIYGDSEGVVVDIRQKSVYLRLSNGITFRVPPENVNVTNLSVGDVVSFSYESHTRQTVIVNPKISRVRYDVPWQSSMEQSELKPSGSGRSGAMRLIFENFVAKNNLDALSPKTWYSLSASDFRYDKKAKAVLKKFGSYVNTVTSLFPEIEFNKNQFKEHKIMGNIHKRRIYLERYAKENGIDPLNPEHWYSHRPKMSSTGKIGLIVNYYSGSIASALVDIFPEIGLDKSKLLYAGAIYKKPNRRKFLEKYAKANGFDPLNPNNWYTQSKKALMAAQGMRGVLWYHKNSVSQALLDLFPEIGLDKAKLERYLWKKTHRRQFFENYAKSKGFDPLNPENWYQQSKSKIKALKGANGVLWYHSSSVSRALLDLFPEIGLDESRIRSTALWTPETRRNFFEDFASRNSFDPLSADNWYARSQKEFAHVKGIARVLWYHGNNVSRALIELFPDVPFNKAKLVYSLANTNVQRILPRSRI